MAITLTCGGMPWRAAPQMNSGNVCVSPALKLVITKSSSDSTNASRPAAARPGRDQRQRDLAERRPLVRAQVHRRLLDVAVHALEPRLHGHDDVGDVEHHVRDHDRHEAGGDVHRQEQREQRGAEHDLGRGQRQEREHVDARRGRGSGGAPARAPSRCRAPARSPSRSAAISSELATAVPEPLDAERVLPVVEREALPGVVEAPLRVVEREQDDDEDRQEQVEQRQPRPQRERAGADAVQVRADARRRASAPRRLRRASADAVVTAPPRSAAHAPSTRV